jgi:hypothetical protein
MAHIKDIPKSKLIIGMMYKDEAILDKTKAILIEKFGKVQDELSYDFTFTDYYLIETGKDLKKKILVFEDLIDREDLPQIKLFTNHLEEDFMDGDKRKINIDPGYMTSHNVVLASAKELPHRSLMKDGIFADVVLVYKHGSFVDNEHTFPDYKSDKVKAFLKNYRL